MQKNRKIRKIIQQPSVIKDTSIRKIDKKITKPVISFELINEHQHTKKDTNIKINISSTKIRILHIVIGLGNKKDRFIRNFISYKDTDKIENYYIVPNTEKNNFIKSNNKIILNDFNNVEILKIANKIKPHAVISSNVIDQNLLMQLKKICNSINYVHHGLISKHLFEIKPDKENSWKKSWLGFNNYFGFDRNFKQFINEMLPGKNVYDYGIPQIDYLLSLSSDDMLKFKKKFTKKYNFKINQKVILLVAGGTGIAFYDYKDYIDHISILGEVAKKNNCKLLVKTKDNIKWYGKPSNTSIKKINDLFDQPHISLIDENYPIYDYFFSDVIVVQETGSVIIEGLIYGKNVIESHINIINDYWGLSKYKNLPYSNDKNKLIELTEKMLNDKYIYDSSFFEEKNKLINELISYDLHSNIASERILNEITKNINI
jgi:hypothetical protein